MNRTASGYKTFAFGTMLALKGAAGLTSAVVVEPTFENPAPAPASQPATDLLLGGGLISLRASISKLQKQKEPSNGKETTADRTLEA